MFEVTPLDVTRATDEELLALRAVYARVESAAGIPPVLIDPPARTLLELRHPPATISTRAVVARDGADVVGVGTVAWEDAPSNRDHVEIEVNVQPSHWGAGVGSAVLRAAVQVAADEFDPRLIDLPARRDDPRTRAFLSRFGFEDRCANPRNVCWTRGLDRPLLESWVERAADRAADYELIGWDGPVPEEYLAAFLDLWDVMNTAPIDDLEWDDEIVTKERARGLEASWAARGITPWTLVARHRATGQFAGFTVLAIDEHWPTVVEQGDTGVRPEHRDRGLGRWLKALNALRLIEERPQVEAITTWNAGSNRPMLSINHAMGFQPIEWWADWQADAKQVLDRLP